MARSAEIRALTRADDRSGFSCGQADLDRFFEHYAGQNQFKLHLAVTYVALVEGRIVGFATVATSSLEGVREGLLVSEPLPMFLGIETIAAALAR